MSRPSVLAAAAAALLAAGCGSTSAPSASKPVSPNGKEVSPAGDIPDNQAYVPFRAPGGFSVKVPEGWSRAKAGSATVFTDKLNTVRVESMTAPVAPTRGEARRVEVPRLARTVPGFKAPRVSTVGRHAGTGVRISYLASARPDPVTGKRGTDAVERYAFFRRGREVVLTLSGPRGADNVDPWRIVTDSLRFAR